MVVVSLNGTGNSARGETLVAFDARLRKQPGSVIFYYSTRVHVNYDNNVDTCVFTFTKRKSGNC